MKCFTFLAGAKADWMKSQLCAAACAGQTHCSCLRLVTGRKGLAISLAWQSLSHAGDMNTKDVRNERHADNKIQRGEIK